MIPLIGLRDQTKQTSKVTVNISTSTDKSSLWLVDTRMGVQYSEYSVIKYNGFMIQSNDLSEKQSEQDTNSSRNEQPYLLLIVALVLNTLKFQMQIFK